MGFKGSLDGRLQNICTGEVTFYQRMALQRKRDTRAKASHAVLLKRLPLSATIKGSIIAVSQMAETRKALDLYFWCNSTTDYFIDIEGRPATPQNLWIGIYMRSFLHEPSGMAQQESNRMRAAIARNNNVRKSMSSSIFSRVLERKKGVSLFSVKIT